MKSPDKGANAGGVDGIIPDINHLADRSNLARHHILTDGNGRYVAVLCQQTGALLRLAKTVAA